MIWTAIIPAAGHGSRFGNTNNPKQYIAIQDRPLLYYTLAALENSDKFRKIIVAVAADYQKSFLHDYVERYALGKRATYEIVVGGASRRDSVYAGLLAASGSDYVAIHDAARPCLSQRLLNDLIATTEKCRAAIPGYPLHDSIKEIRPNTSRIERSMDRKLLWAVQTPQCFDYALVLRAYEKGLAENIPATDDAELVERLGQEVQIVASDAWNIKVTYPEDLLAVKAILEQRHE